MTGHVAMVTCNGPWRRGPRGRGIRDRHAAGLGAENLLATLPWLLGGVVAHDGAAPLAP